MDLSHACSVLSWGVVLRWALRGIVQAKRSNVIKRKRITRRRFQGAVRKGQKWAGEVHSTRSSHLGF